MCAIAHATHLKHTSRHFGSIVFKCIAHPCILPDYLVAARLCFSQPFGQPSVARAPRFLLCLPSAGHRVFSSPRAFPSLPSLRPAFSPSSASLASPLAICSPRPILSLAYAFLSASCLCRRCFRAASPAFASFFPVPANRCSISPLPRGFCTSLSVMRSPFCPSLSRLRLLGPCLFHLPPRLFLHLLIHLSSSPPLFSFAPFCFLLFRLSSPLLSPQLMAPPRAHNSAPCRGLLESGRPLAGLTKQNKKE